MLIYANLININLHKLNFSFTLYSFLWYWVEGFKQQINQPLPDSSIYLFIKSVKQPLLFYLSLDKDVQEIMLHGVI